LTSQIKLRRDPKFRGRGAVRIGRIFPEERIWQRYSLVHYFAQSATGNLHDGPELWQDDVPTLMEYNTLITPAYFAFVRAFLTDPRDIQYRNIIGTRHIDPRILKLRGVRFVTTDLPISGGQSLIGIHRQFGLGRTKLPKIDAVQLEVLICKAEQPSSLGQNRNGDLSAQ